MLRNFSTQKEQSWFRQVGTSPLECWYPCGAIASPLPATFGTTEDIFYAVPFYTGRGGSIDRIAFEVTTIGAGSKGRCGIYTSDEDGYPKTLVVDSGEFTTNATGVKSATISVALPQNALFFAVLLFGTTSSSPIVRSIDVRYSNALFAYGSAIGTTRRAGLTGAYTYGALPASAPSGLTPGMTSAPIVALRYSA
jgi:hypothetical protein